MVRDGDGPPEDDPLHDFATWWSGQGAGVPVVAAQGCRQEVPEDKRIQEGLLLCLEKEHNGNLHDAANAITTPGLLVLHHSLVFVYAEQHWRLMVENMAVFPRACSERTSTGYMS
jgi:hypothetical protein